MIGGSYDGIYITDGSANTIMVNESYEIISGLKREDVLGKNMRDLVKDDIINVSGTLMAIESREPVTLEQEFQTGTCGHHQHTHARRIGRGRIGDYQCARRNGAL